MNKKINRIPLSLLLPLLALSPLLAQDLDKEAQKPQQETAAQAGTAALAAEAVKAEPAESKDVTYEQVLANPDDPELNYAYAKTQVRKGDLKGAAATLERMLMVNPGLNNIRLFYGLVLYRLDDLPEAQRELETVRQSSAAQAVKAEAGDYLEAIKRKQRLTSASGGFSAGLEYDSNRNASPTSQKRLFLDTPLQLTGASRKKDDTSFLFMGSGEVRRVVDRKNKHEVFGSVSYFRADQDRVKAVNLQAVSLKAGGGYKAGRSELKPYLLYDRVLLDRVRFLNNSGAGLRYERKLDKLNEVSAEAKYVFQDHLTSKDIASNPERRGPLYALTAGAGRVLTPVMKLNADLNYSGKRAKKVYNSYDSLSLVLRHSWLLGKGRFLLSSVSLGNDVYRRNDPAISAKRRKDATFRAGVTAGAPLSTFHRKLSGLKDLTLTLSLEHFRSNSTVLNYTYVNNKAALLLSYRWDLGL